MPIPDTKNLLSQMMSAFQFLRQTPDFIIRRKLWKGYMDTGWIAKLVVLGAIMFSYFFITGIIGLFTQPPQAEVTEQGTSVMMSKLNMLGDKLILSGSMKYLVLILMETMIFHFAVKTYEYLSGIKRELTIKDFVHAEIRMIKVSIRSWFYELIISIVVMAILKLFGFKILSNISFFLIQSYFIGVAFIDNYNEQSGIKIKESFAIAYNHMGAAVLIGMVAYVLFLVPLIGIVITPFICAVATTFYMYYATTENPNIAFEHKLKS